MREIVMRDKDRIQIGWFQNRRLAERALRFVDNATIDSDRRNDSFRIGDLK